MGKRNNKRNAAKGQFKLSPRIRSELTALVDEAFKGCTNTVTVNTVIPDWDEYLDLFNLMERIRALEKNLALPSYDRLEQVAPFDDWLKSIGVEMDGVSISNCGDEGLGLVASTELDEAERVLVVPRAAILSEETALKSCMGSFFEKDPILQNMGNVTLALHLLGECFCPDSKWGPYFKILPSSYSTLLYYTPEQLKLLKGSPLFHSGMKLFKYISRQYTYFYRIFQTAPIARSWPIKERFTFDAYRWAVSTVMARGNKILNASLGWQMALIPAWDMANHEYGQLSTDFDDQTDRLICFAHRKFSPNEQFKIHYGKRTNAELFTNSGFVCKDNPDDNFPLKFALSNHDSNFEQKSKFLQSVGVPTSGHFLLLGGPKPISEELLAIVRIFTMDKESLDVLEGKIDKDKIIMDLNSDLGGHIDEKTWKFLLTRIELLIKSYPTSLKEDEESFISAILPESLIHSLLIEEKKILLNASKFISAKLSN